jgi:hypothetical protein
MSLLFHATRAYWRFDRHPKHLFAVPFQYDKHKLL